jgi:putative ABC transport system ATP-binding protein
MSEHRPILRTERLSRTYPDGKVRALVDATLSIARGEYVAVMGPSGSGKSTLLNLLGALDVPTGGEIFFEEQPYARLPSLDRFRALQLGFVFQSFYLLPTLTAAENVQIPMFETGRRAAARAARAGELLELVGMAHRMAHLPNQLSVGERQRVAIARALANEPQILLADEPTGNLDSASAAQVLDLFDQLHRDREMTVVMVTHGDDVAGRAERIIRLYDGRVCQPAESPPAGPEAAAPIAGPTFRSTAAGPRRP